MSGKANKVQGLPEGWREVRLGDISTKVMYGMNSESVDFDGNNKYIRITDIDEKTRKFTPTLLTSPAGKLEEKYRLQKNDILFARTGASVGKTYLYDKRDGILYFAGYLIKFNIVKENAKFVHIQTLSKKYADWIVSMSSRSGQPGVNAEQYKNLPLLLPPLPEQKAIASLLETWDTAIEKTEALIAAKEKRFKWLLKTLISDQHDNPEWRTIKLENICRIKKGEQLNKLQMIETGKYPALNDGIVPSGYTDKWNTPANTVTISEGGNSCGYVRFNTKNFWAGGHCYTLVDLVNNLDVSFLYFQLKEKEQPIMKLRVGSGLPNIQKGDIEKFPFTLPPLSQQKYIVNILNTTQRKIHLLKQSAKIYRTQKRGFIQKLLTGKWKVAV